MEISRCVLLPHNISDKRSHFNRAALKNQICWNALQFGEEKFRAVRSRALFLFVFVLVETRGCDILPCTDCEEIAPLEVRAPNFFSPGRSNLLRRPCISHFLEIFILCKLWQVNLHEVTSCRTIRDSSYFLRNDMTLRLGAHERFLWRTLRQYIAVYWNYTSVRCIRTSAKINVRRD